MTYETKNVDCLLSLLASLIYHFLLLLQVGFLPAGGPRKQLASPKRLQTSWFIMLGKLLYRSFGFFAAKYGQAALSPSDPWLMHKPRQSLTASCWLLVPLAWDANKLQFELGVPFSWCRGTELPSRIPLHSASYHQLNQPNKVYDKTRWNNTPNVILIGRRFLEHSLSLFLWCLLAAHQIMLQSKCLMLRLNRFQPCGCVLRFNGTVPRQLGLNKPFLDPGLLIQIIFPGRSRARQSKA